MSEKLKPLAKVNKTCVGPELFVAGVKTRVWLGTAHDNEADELAAQINNAVPADPVKKALAELVVDLKDRMQDVEKQTYWVFDSVLFDRIDAALSAYEKEQAQ